MAWCLLSSGQTHFFFAFLLRNQTMHKSNRGFTLVEIAIVLVIVGLLIGGVLKGQEMITNAKVKRIESDNSGISAAMFSYQDRYQELPGDDPGAEGRFSDYTAGSGWSGGGDNTVDGPWDDIQTAVASAPETQKFWAHLRASGLIAGGATDLRQPSNAYGGKIGIQHGGFNFGGHSVVFGELNGNIVNILESRLDDGVPDAGRIRGQVEDGTTLVTASTLPTTYVDDTVYNIGFRL
jgi:prepilin-type N-terminal cleavage/methylation domain-containing protein